MRASDEDRQRTVDELRRHCAAGRIDVDEYASRVEQALSAGTLEELDGIRADLPMLRIAEPAGSGVWAARRPRVAGPPVSVPESGRDRGTGRVAGVQGTVLALAVAAVTVTVVVAAIVLSLAVEWTWAAVLLAGWALGLLQGRLARRAWPHR